MDEIVVTLHNLHLGRLHFCLGHNTSIDLERRPFRTFRFDRIGRQVFISARIGQRFLDVDFI